MSTPTPQPIADWLDKLGVGQYAQHFVENEIDVSVLRHLTDQEGRDMHWYAATTVAILRSIRGSPRGILEITVKYYGRLTWLSHWLPAPVAASD